MAGTASIYALNEKASRKWFAFSLATIFAATAILYGAGKVLVPESASASNADNHIKDEKVITPDAAKNQPAIAAKVMVPHHAMPNVLRK